jgi:hypothetical protein
MSWTDETMLSFGSITPQSSDTTGSLFRTSVCGSSKISDSSLDLPPLLNRPPVLLAGKPPTMCTKVHYNGVGKKFNSNPSNSRFGDTSLFVIQATGTTNSSYPIGTTAPQATQFRRSHDRPLRTLIHKKHMAITTECAILVCPFARNPDDSTRLSPEFDGNG